MEMTDRLILILCSIVFVLMLALNIWNRRARADMTPEERKEEDENQWREPW